MGETAYAIATADGSGAGIALEMATARNVPEIVALMNRAYRSRTGKQWTTEGGYITGSRTTEALLREELAQDAAMLLWRRKDGSLLGCVRLEPEANGVWYLGSLTIEPAAQAAGLGRRLLAAAEAWAAARGAHAIRMTVVHLRAALIAWYERRGYRLTGETEPFPYGDDRFGTPLRDDLRFIVMTKTL